MKILILSDGFPPDQQGGAESVVAQLALGYRQHGHSVTVITTTRQRERERVEQWRGIRVYWLYISYGERWRAYLSLYDPKVVAKVWRIVTDEKPDIVHAHNLHFYLSYYTLLLVKKRGCPVVLTFHDAMAVDYGKFTQGIPLHDHSENPKVNYRIHPWRTFLTYRFRYFPLRNFIIRQYLHHCTDARIAVSHELRRLLETNGIQCSGVIHNGINPDEWHVDAKEVIEFRQRLGLQGRKVILFAGRGGFWKGSQQLVKALPNILKIQPQSILVILGQHEHFSSLLNEARSLGVLEYLICPGWLQGKELVAAYCAADVVVVPSLYLDAFPTVILEGMAAKKPVIVSCFSGGKEAVIDGQTGYIVNPLNTEVLGQRIVDLLTNERKSHQMGELGYQRLLNNFTLDRCAKAYLALFDYLLLAKR